MKDLAIHETGNGGDIFIINNDFTSVETLIQQVFISLFGGNVEASTIGNEIESEKRSDWWANDLLFSERKGRQFNSETERVLNNVVLNSSGRLSIERAVKNDLSHLQKIVSLRSEVSIPAVNRVDIRVYIQELKNKETKILQLLWDNAKKEIIIQKEL